ncbi:NlpC/P60 family putative phage cell wall peptidase [Pacificibacter maritimus]|uniref:NlpC/P60 family putative phage cell wall peptidase n=1 Tax=Pacificibacter maritimus TaxID=762213 RepID=A0A3N4UMQ4_9RHOB|nr:NlpC/P60 family protein [Pacificibacter maritimus]RPE71298.1 NlpC/P60 family putative phage cell wall peptidase [Pacificibacter maritimus]
MQAETIVSATREWIGTPYVHQASCKGAGTDCLGLLRGVWRELYGQEPELVPAYTQDWSEPQRDERLLHAAQRHLVQKPLEQMQGGDVLLFRMRSKSVAKHVGIVATAGAAPTFIHAYSGHSVVENALTAPWRRRVAACFSFPQNGG